MLISRDPPPACGVTVGAETVLSRAAASGHEEHEQSPNPWLAVQCGGDTDNKLPRASTSVSVLVRQTGVRVTADHSSFLLRKLNRFSDSDCHNSCRNPAPELELHC